MSTWTLTRHDRIAVATFHHPPRNLMTFGDMAELERIVRDVAADESVTVLVLASDTPGYFVCHGDLEDLVRLGRGEETTGDPGAWPRTLELFESMPQIVVAAIDGQAWGGGLEMSLATTLRVAGPRADFAFCEVGIGLIPGAGGTQRLPRLIGPGRAMELTLSTRSVGPEEALRIGLVQETFDEEPFLDAVLAWLTPIAERTPASLHAAKRAVLGAMRLPLDQGIEFEASLVGPLITSPEAIKSQEDAIATYAATPTGQTVRF